MRSFGKYFWNRIKSTWIITLVTCVIFFAISLILSMNYSNGSGFYLSQYKWTQFAVTVCIILFPIISFWDINGKRSAEALFSLPVNRSKIATIHLLHCILQTVLITVICHFTYWRCSFKVYLTNFPFRGLFSVSLLFYILLGISGCIINSFLLVVADNRFDGCLFVGVWQNIPWLILSVMSHCYFNLPYRIFHVDAFPNFPYMEELIVDFYFRCIKGIPYYSDGVDYSEINHAAFSFVSAIIISVILTAGYFILFNKKSVHKIGGVSESVFGYPLLIIFSGLVIASGSAHKGSYTGDIMLLWAIIFGFAGCMLYRRSVKIKRWDLLIVGLIPILFFLLLAVNYVLEKQGVLF